MVIRSYSRKILVGLLLSMLLLCCPAFADLSGNYIDDNGNKVVIVQNQQRLSIRVQGPRGIKTYEARMLPTKTVQVPAGPTHDGPQPEFEFVDEGITYKGRCYGGKKGYPWTMTVGSNVKFLSNWKPAPIARTPVEGPGAVRLDPSGSWMDGSGRAIVMRLQKSGNSIKVVLQDLKYQDSLPITANATWTSTNTFEFSIKGLGKTTCQIDWYTRPTGMPRTVYSPYQITTHGALGEGLWGPTEF